MPYSDRASHAQLVSVKSELPAKRAPKESLVLGHWTHLGLGPWPVHVLPKLFSYRSAKGVVS
jgi:hypothetical protein